MDDLLGEDWQRAPKPSSDRSIGSTSFAASFRSLQPSPQPSLSSTPANLSRPSSTVTGGLPRSTSTTPKPAADAFGTLLGSKSGKAAGTANVSIQERQRQLVEERQRQLQAQAQLWDSLGGGSVNGRSRTVPQKVQDDEDDILAAFNKDAKVDNASHFPPPPALATPQASSGSGTPMSGGMGAGPQNLFAEDDDTFGLGSMSARSNGHVKPAAALAEDDDILGDLGRPIAARGRPVASQDSSDSENEWDENVANTRSSARETGARDGALAELIDMGFPAASAQEALSKNEGDAQRAVGWLLQQAHEESRRKAREQQEQESNGVRPAKPDAARRHGQAQRREDTRHEAGMEKDASQIAQEFGSKLFKSANSLWKAGQKQVAKTMSDFQQERDPSQPKWMQAEVRESAQRAPQKDKPNTIVTNEAALLDMPRNDAPSLGPKADRVAEPTGRRNVNSSTRVESTERKQPVLQDRRPASKLTRQDVEEQSAAAYVSPARRRKTAPQPAPPGPEAEVDLFSSAPIKQQAEPEVDIFTSAVPVPKAKPGPSVRAQVSKRTIPPVSDSALSTSAAHRKRGTEAFKRGDYGAAHEAYAAALVPLPLTHPIVIVVLSNRSLTALKTGDAKMAVSDAERALELIGTSLGSGESIEVEGESKDMREFYGKALMRKAEALEHMEKWVEAGSAWRQAVEAGVGGAVSARGRDRCERAAVPKPVQAKPAVKKAAKPSIAPKSSTQSAEAVRKLREANAAADKADDEKFLLGDKVNARLTAWKGGKADNLRSLLQSMDTVLWPEAGWKKVGMSDLVMANKVKIIYMKAIAKVHPDKIAQDASMEQRMISGAVFSTLNEAWDKFKKDNNL